jgi:hypothetical protein
VIGAIVTHAFPIATLRTHEGTGLLTSNENGMRRSRTELHQHFVRRSVDLLAEDRDRCGGCGRTPLTGEHVHRYDDGQLLCELCRPLRRIEDAREEVVRHSEHGHAVRLVARVAA